MSSPSENEAPAPEGSQPPAPDANCEWCNEPATLRIPIMKRIKGVKGMADSGTRVLACSEHEKQAREVARNYG